MTHTPKTARALAVLTRLAGGAVLLQSTPYNPTPDVLNFLTRLFGFLVLTITQSLNFAFFPEGLSGFATVY